MSEEHPHDAPHAHEHEHEGETQVAVGTLVGLLAVTVGGRVNAFVMRKS